VSIDRSLLSRGLAALSLPPEGELADALFRYLSEIELWNPAYGLVKATGEELVVKHALDSLAPLALIRSLLPPPAPASFGLPPRRPRIADLGTGAGLPGIPLALAMSDADVDLVDRMGKRIRFLENMAALLPLPNARVVQSEVERAQGSYDLVTFRAFRPFEPKLFASVFALCDPEGAVVAYKGKAAVARAELPAIEGLYASAEILPIEVPMLAEERCVVVMRPATR
jgi:16S rRNA (guanine527-N7)-methyltransferase